VWFCVVVGGGLAGLLCVASWLRMRNRDGRYTLMFEEWVTEGDFIISPR
jgi:hypothetical protein